MSDLSLLIEAQMARLSPHFPLAHSVPRVDDRRAVSGIVYVIRYGRSGRTRPRPVLHPLAIKITFGS